MHPRGIISAGLVAALGLGGASRVLAQSTVNATALVGQPVSAQALRGLDFVTVFPGFDKTVAYTDNNSASAVAGLIQLKGQHDANVLVSFSLPTTLDNGPNTLPIDGWTGCGNLTNTTSGCTPFTPQITAQPMVLSGTVVTDPPPRTFGYRYLFIGATVHPAAAQPSGTYSGTVVVNVVYM